MATVGCCTGVLLPCFSAPDNFNGARGEKEQVSSVVGLDGMLPQCWDKNGYKTMFRNSGHAASKRVLSKGREKGDTFPNRAECEKLQ